MACYCNPETCVAINRPIEMKDALEAEGYVLVSRETAEPVKAAPVAKKSKKGDSAQ